MKLLELTMFNFCIYKGEQTFQLAPDVRYGKPRPVILVGGINGGGKTTLFDAVLLVLYGARANCSKRAGQTYSDFLAGCIHRGVDPSDGSSITLSFQYAADGQQNIYEVCRRWSVKNGVLRENLSVKRDGKKEDWLTSKWNQKVEEIIPLGISQLFFFDAEKIRFIAEDETTSEALGSAIKYLLGLDLAERIISDTKVVEMRLAEGQLEAKDTELIEDLRSKLKKIKDQIESVDYEIGKNNEELNKANDIVATAEKEFSLQGGVHWEKRKETKSEHEALLKQRSELEEELRFEAYSELPLLLNLDLLEEIKATAANESDQKDGALVREAMSKRDKKIVAALEKKGVEASVIASVVEQQKKTLPKKPKKSDSVYALSSHAMDRLGGICDEASKRCSQLSEMVGEHQTLSRDLDLAKRSLAASPKDDAIKSVVEDYQAALKEQAKIAQVKKSLAEKNGELDREFASVEQELEKLLLESVDADVKTTDAARMAGLASRSREVMAQFLNRSTVAKIDRLSEYILESFRYLLRKSSLIEAIDIDPETFQIRLVGKDGESIPKQRLSEGEKQIFAISVLWGLSRASKRRLPAIIDTPMARLDSAHRDNLLTKYFPQASHQTIILSTDTEVDENYFESLEPHISRAYFLKYSEKKRQTSVEEGYFWKPAEVAK